MFLYDMIIVVSDYLSKGKCEMLKEEENIIHLIRNDSWMMDILKTAQILQLPDWWICAGFVRSKIWDTLHDFSERTPLPDIYVVYFDAVNISVEKEKQYENQLHELMPNIPWSVKNQARMHERNRVAPYNSTVDGIAKFPETATALGVKLTDDQTVLLAAPHGVEDVIHLRIKPTPFFKESPERLEIFKERVEQKNWTAIWNKLTF